MDIFQSEVREHVLAIADRHTEYVWCRKTGYSKTGTADVVLQILKETLGAGLYFVKRLKTDQGKNLIGGVIKEISKQLGIWQDTLSAYNPAGNTFAENTVQRIKKALGDKRIEDAIMDIDALNICPPYDGKRLSPFESMHGFVSPANGISMTETGLRELVSREWLTDKVNTKENPLPKLPEDKNNTKLDKHRLTEYERIISKEWMEKIHEPPKEKLEEGDQVFFVDHAEKGYGRWRPGFILQRKTQYEYPSGSIHDSKGHDIWDLQTCRRISRTRADIRKCKMDKVDLEVREELLRFLEKAHKAFLRDTR